eukprot:9894355-Heterocapsa_arctica.AAC.1
MRDDEVHQCVDVRPFLVSTQPGPEVALGVARDSCLGETCIEVVKDDARHVGREHQVAAPVRGELVEAGGDEGLDRDDHLLSRPATTAGHNGFIPLVLNALARVLKQTVEVALVVSAICHGTRIPNYAGSERAFGAAVVEGRVDALRLLDKPQQSPIFGARSRHPGDGRRSGLTRKRPHHSPPRGTNVVAG